MDRISRWRQALLLPGETDLIQSGLLELAEYYGIGLEEARRACETAISDSRREWESVDRDTPEKVLSFYRTTQSYIFEHVWWHATEAEKNSSNVTILEYGLQSGAREYLDFGSGVGGNAILFAQHGMNVTLADVSRTMLEFAKWRMERHGLKAAYVNLNEQDLPRERFDLASAVDVFEHLADPHTEISRISSSLRAGGVLVFNDCTGVDPDRPMHIVRTPYPILRSLRCHGFRNRDLETEELRRVGYRVMKRVLQGPVSSLAWRLCDGVLYAPLGLARELRLTVRCALGNPGRRRGHGP